MAAAAAPAPLGNREDLIKRLFKLYLNQLKVNLSNNVLIQQINVILQEIDTVEHLSKLHEQLNSLLINLDNICNIDNHKQNLRQILRELGGLQLGGLLQTRGGKRKLRKSRKSRKTRKTRKSRR